MSIRSDVARALRYSQLGHLLSNPDSTTMAGDAIRAFIGALTAAGYRIVPVEATEAMARAIVGGYLCTLGPNDGYMAWKGGIAAAPPLNVESDAHGEARSLKTASVSPVRGDLEIS